MPYRWTFARSFVSIGGIAVLAACGAPREPERLSPKPPDLAHRLPDFHPDPLVTWGPIPPGAPREMPAPAFELLHQTVRVRADRGTRSLVGSVTYRVRAAGEDSVRSIRLDAAGIAVTRVLTSGRRLEHTRENGIVEVQLRTPLSTRPADVRVEFTAPDTSGAVRWLDAQRMVVASGERAGPRWLPASPFPFERSTLDLYVRSAPDERVVATGRLVSRRRVGRELEWRFTLDEPAPAGEIGLAIGVLGSAADSAGRTLLGYAARPDTLAAARRALAGTRTIAELFARESGARYPHRRYDQLLTTGASPVPDATGFVVLPLDGVVVPRWATPHLDPDALVARRLAGQWARALVRQASWREAWREQALAEWLVHRWVLAARGGDDAAWARTLLIEEALAADRGARRPLAFDRWVESPAELGAGAHARARGAMVFHMLHRELGDSLFGAAMRAFAETGMLRAAFEEVSGRDLGPLFDQWVERAGYPAFRIGWSYDSTSRRLTMDIRQVQPRDSLTGLFAGVVDMEAHFADGSRPKRWRVAVRGERTQVELDDVPSLRWLTWDAGDHLIDIADFPRPTAMLAEQLAWDVDVTGRRSALGALATRLRDPAAVRAIEQALRRDPFWGIRLTAVPALAAARGDSVAYAALHDATHDPDARVREAAARALVAFPGEHSVARLRIVALSDPSLVVRAAALGSYAALDPRRALRDLEDALARDSWLDIVRAAALGALRHVDAERAWELARPYVDEPASPVARRAAIATLVAVGGGRDADLILVLEPQLAASDPAVREAAVSALATLRLPGIAATLQARRQVEPDPLVRQAIDRALRELTS